MTREEQETTICWDAATKMADIFSADPSVIRKLDKLVAEYPDVYRCTKVDAKYGNKFYQVPAKYIRFGKPTSEARREASRNALSKGAKTAPSAEGVS